ncbi:restriction endonuclease subunit S [Ligilactobacillus murinus]|uniref:restriction endonuclease subunit S n=2 Tax=Ligilactobacillus murinus TaxID=1622 RepID=UPI001C3D71E7|nr:restriction endonuclease subunit S [Ligilactobacillus murinus]
MVEEKKNIPKVRFREFAGDDANAWEQRKLGEIVEWSKGSGLSKDALNIQGIGVPVIHYADLYKFNSVQKEVIHWTMNDIGTKIPENNLLFPMSDVTPDGLARTSTVLQSNVKAGGDVLIAKLNKDILSTFMSYQINRNKNQILPLVTGTTVRHINSKSLSTLKVTVPGKNEQKYVGSILMRFDSLIALHQRELDNYKMLKKTMLSKMFPKNDEKYPEIRFTGFAYAWELRKLKEILEINPKTEKIPDIFEYVDLGSVVGTDLIKHTKTLKESAPSRAQRLAKKGDVFYQTVRPYQKNNYLYELQYNNYIFSTGYAQLRPYSGVDSNFLLNCVQEEKFVTTVLNFCTGTSYPAINSKDLGRVMIKIPKSTEQQKIGDFFKHLDELITLHQRELESLKTLKKNLLQQMFV